MSHQIQLKLCGGIEFSCDKPAQNSAYLQNRRKLNTCDLSPI